MFPLTGKVEKKLLSITATEHESRGLNKHKWDCSSAAYSVLNIADKMLMSTLWTLCPLLIMLYS